MNCGKLQYETSKSLLLPKIKAIIKNYFIVKMFCYSIMINVLYNRFCSSVNKKKKTQKQVLFNIHFGFRTTLSKSFDPQMSTSVYIKITSLKCEETVGKNLRFRTKLVIFLQRNGRYIGIIFFFF